MLVCCKRKQQESNVTLCYSGNLVIFSAGTVVILSFIKMMTFEGWLHVTGQRQHAESVKGELGALSASSTDISPPQ